MKKIFFILFLIPIISYCQTDTEFKLQNSIVVKWEKNIHITKNDYFLLNDDTSNFCSIMLYSYGGSGKKQAIDSIDYSGLLYGSTLNSFKNENDNSHVVLWKVDGEYNPFFYIYYIKDGKLMKIGEWVIYEPPGEILPDRLDYSVKNIRIYKINDEIEFSFLKDVEFMVYRENHNYDEWGTFKAGKLTVSFNIIDGSIKEIK